MASSLLRNALPRLRAARQKVMLARDNFDGLHMWHNSRPFQQVAHVSFLNKRHYNYKFDQITLELEAKSLNYTMDWVCKEGFKTFKYSCY